LSSWLPAAGIVLGVPAMLVMGISASPHCALMCAPLTQLAGTQRSAQWQLHGGRLLSYLLLGALAGGIGGSLMLQMQRYAHPDQVRLAAAVALLIFGALQWRAARPRPACCKPPWSLRAESVPAWMRGLLWGLLPCPLLWAVLGLATLAGDAIQGGMLTLAFGIGTSPLLLAMSGIGPHLARRWSVAQRRHTGATMLMLSGLWIASGMPVLGELASTWCSLR